MKIKHTLVSNLMINIIRRLTEPTRAVTAFKITYAGDERNAFETINFKVIFQKC